MNNNSQKTKQLNEINVLRPIVILSLVLMHSFTMYGGGWPLPKGIKECIPYYWIAKISFACLLETFTFVSGYLMAHSIQKIKQNNLKFLAIKKIHRLLIPSVVFSFLYSLIFYEKPYLSIRYLYDLISGIGHMWYLPMLFWCFIFSYLILKININELCKLFILLILTFFSFLPLPFRLGATCYYLFFFYFGFLIYSIKKKLRITNIKIIFLFVMFLVVFVVSLKIHNNLLNTSNIDNVNIYTFFITNITKISYASIGLLFLYFISVKISENFDIPKIILDFNKICFSIYIIHQFVLKFLYYKVEMPELCGTYLLPWVCFIISLIISIILSRIILLTKIGKYLIG